MTRDKIAVGLQMLTLLLANRQPTHEPPDGWTVHEWAYVCGVASAAIMRLRDDVAGPRSVGTGDMQPKPLSSLDVVATTAGKATIETKR